MGGGAGWGGAAQQAGHDLFTMIFYDMVQQDLEKQGAQSWAATIGSGREATESQIPFAQTGYAGLGALRGMLGLEPTTTRAPSLIDTAMSGQFQYLPPVDYSQGPEAGRRLENIMKDPVFTGDLTMGAVESYTGQGGGGLGGVAREEQVDEPYWSGDPADKPADWGQPGGSGGVPAEAPGEEGRRPGDMTNLPSLTWGQLNTMDPRDQLRWLEQVAASAGSSETRDKAQSLIQAFRPQVENYEQQQGAFGVGQAAADMMPGTPQFTPFSYDQRTPQFQNRVGDVLPATQLPFLGQQDRFFGAREDVPGLMAQRQFGPAERMGRFEAPTLDDIERSAAYQFRLGEGMRAIENSAAAQGMQLSGANLRDLNRFAQNVASEEFSNEYGRRMGEYQTNLQRQQAQFGQDISSWGANQQSIEELNRMGLARQQQMFSQQEAQNQINYLRSIGEYELANQVQQQNYAMAQSANEAQFQRDVQSYGLDAAREAQDYSRAFQQYTTGYGMQQDIQNTLYNRYSDMYNRFAALAGLGQVAGYQGSQLGVQAAVGAAQANTGTAGAQAGLAGNVMSTMGQSAQNMQALWNSQAGRQWTSNTLSAMGYGQPTNPVGPQPVAGAGSSYSYYGGGGGGSSGPVWGTTSQNPMM